MDDNSLFTTEVLFSLKDLGIQKKNFICYDHITMTQRYICARETNNVMIIDMTKPVHPIRLSITARSAIMNPDTLILALIVPVTTPDADERPQYQLQIFNVEAETIIKSYHIAEWVEYWKWITPKTLGLFTETAVYHWSLEELTGPVKMFDRINGCLRAPISNYLCDPSEKWLAVIVKRNFPVYEADLLIKPYRGGHEWYRIRGVLAAAFATFDVEENGTISTLLCYCARELSDEKEHIRIVKLCANDMAHVAQHGEPGFVKKRAESIVPCKTFPYDPVQILPKDGLIYVIYQHGKMSIHDLETAEAICSCSIKNFEPLDKDRIILTTEGTSSGSFYSIDEGGQVLLTNIKTLLSRGILHDLRKFCMQINKIKGFNKQYAERKNEKEKIITKLEKSLQKSLQEEIREKKEREKQFTRIGIELLNEIEEMKKERTKLQDKIEGLRKHCAELKTEKGKFVAEPENSLREEIKNMDRIEEQFTWMINKIEKMKKVNTKLQDKIIADTTKSLQVNESSKIEIEQLTSQIKELNKFQESHEEMLHEVERLKKQIAELTMERDKTIRDLEQFRLWIEGFDSSTNHLEDKFIEFTHAELKAVTNDFSNSLKIGEGGYGLVYKAFFGLKPVAIKILKYENRLANNEFNQEVKILSRVRHPNLVMLLGACTEAQALVYELMPNGSLYDNLRNKQQPNALTWKTRICIAANICSALIVLHSTNPHGIVHGDLKSANILLDSNYIAKLSDFGICRHLRQTDTRITPHHYTNYPKGTLPYMDPVYLETGDMTAQYDVYSFGIVLLELVTGRSPIVGFRKVVEAALRKGQNFVDFTAGEWPFEEAKRMVLLGLQCSDPLRENRPDLEKEVWVKIESMRRTSLRF